MTVWSWIHFISFVVYLLLFAYILGRGSKTFLNWVAASLVGCFALWSFGNFMLFNNFSTIESSNIILKIEAPGWIFFSSLYVLFILEFTGSKKLSRNPVIIFLLFFIPIIIYISYFTGGMVVCCDKTYFGYTGRWLPTFWAKIFYIYYFSFFLTGEFLLFRYAMKEVNISKKNTAIILIIAMFFCFILGTITSVYLKIKRQYVPVEANVWILIFAAGIQYSMIKYDFLAVTPEKAANLIINTMNDALILLDNKGKILNLNEAAFTIFECETEIIKDCNHILPEHILQKIFSEIEKDGKIINEQIDFITLKDNKKTLLLSASVLKNKNQKIGYVCILKDITELKLAKKELEEIILKLIKSNKELEQFAYIISHDLKEPLRMISSYVQLLQKKYQDKLDGNANEYIEFAADGAKRMNGLIDGLLEYSRVLSGDIKFEKADIKQLIEDALALLRVKIEEKNATIKIKSDLPVLNINKINITRVFQNLIDNGLKFCREKPIIEISAEEKKGFFLFCIKDNGIGINIEHKERIFEIFQRLHSRDKYDGIGIGLTICRKIIERHNGKIWMESEGEGKGCSFYFTLPCA